MYTCAYVSVYSPRVFLSFVTCLCYAKRKEDEDDVPPRRVSTNTVMLLLIIAFLSITHPGGKLCVCVYVCVGARRARV